MWPFNRRKKSSNNLKERVSPTAVKEYYQAAGSRQSWIIWVLSIGTFILTLLIVLLLFWGGRWVWQKISDSSDDKPTTTQEQSSDLTEDKTKRQGDDNTGSDVPAPAPSPTPQPTPAPTTPPTQNQRPTTPVTGDLPHTGPSSDE